MREIKFRGLRTDGKGWAIGSLLSPNIKDEKCYIIGWNGSRFEVIPETVGQYTGLKDKNGNDIYEGDVLICKYWVGENYILEYKQDDRHTGYWFPKDDTHLIELIGNIHEN